MKFKNISIVEQHIEKVFVALCVVMFLAVVYVYYFTDRFTATVRNQTISWKNLDQTINDKANELKRKLNTDLPSDLEITVVPDYEGMFLDNYFDPGIPDNLAMVSLPNINIDQIDMTEREDRFYHKPTVPAPRYLTLRQDIATLDPAPILANTDLSDYFSSTPPYNVQWVSIVSRFSVMKLIKAFEEQNDITTRPISRDWWSLLVFTDVQVEREEKLSNGHWGNSKIIDALPGSLLAEVRKQIINIETGPAAANLVSYLDTNCVNIVQPPFYQLLNRTWEPVKIDVPYITEDDNEIMVRNKTALLEINSQLARVLLRIENDGGEISDARQTQIDGYETRIEQLETTILDGGGTLPDGTTGRRPRTTTTRTTTRRPARTPTRPALVRPDFGDARDQGVRTSPQTSTPSPRIRPATTTQPRSVIQQISRFNLSSDDLPSINLWAHDITLEAGKTYRYRMRACVTNPLFGRKIALPEAQYETDGKQFALLGEWSEWSNDIQTIKEDYFFLVGASPVTSQASIEVWKFSESKWHKAEFRVTPGDPIGTVRSNPETLIARKRSPGITIDFNTGKSLVDVDQGIAMIDGKEQDKSPRILYLDDGEIFSRYMISDLQTRRTTREAIEQTMPEEVAAAAEAARLERERLERQREQALQERRSRAAASRSTRTTTTRSGGTSQRGRMEDGRAE